MAVPTEVVWKSTFTVFGRDRESVTSNRTWPAFSAALASAIEMLALLTPGLMPLIRIFLESTKGDQEPLEFQSRYRLPLPMTQPDALPGSWLSEFVLLM